MLLRALEIQHTTEGTGPLPSWTLQWGEEQTVYKCLFVQEYICIHICTCVCISCAWVSTMWEWVEENSGGNLGVCFHCPEKRPWSLDEDSSTEKRVTLRGTSILYCVGWRRETVVGNYVSLVWTSGWVVWPHTMNENKKRGAGEFSLRCLCHT